MSGAASFPAAVHTIVVGAGTAGCVVAGRLAANNSQTVLLLEAGPDYGPAASGRWPRELLDATKVASTHDWGYTGEFGGRVIHFGRARVVGGCSAHNAGAVVHGSRSDYDGWAAAGNAGWSARELAPLFAAAWKQLRVRRVARRAGPCPRRPGGGRGRARRSGADGNPRVAGSAVRWRLRYPRDCSARCRAGSDLHVYPVGGGTGKDPSNWYWFLGVACLTPLSRGSVRLTGPGPDDKLLIDHRYLSDPDGSDRARLAEGVERVCAVARAPELRRLLGRRTRPGPVVTGRQAIERFIDHAAVHYYHPAGSCKMGPAGDPDSVADAAGRVHGIEDLYAADASLMPAVTSGNTNMPVTVIGERIAQSLLA